MAAHAGFAWNEDEDEQEQGGLLKDVGWDVWSRNLRQAWQAYAVLEIGMGQLPIPIVAENAPAEDKELLQMWLLLDRRASNLLRRRITEEHEHVLDGARTSAEMYTRLALHCEKEEEGDPATALLALVAHKWDRKTSTLEENLAYIQTQMDLVRRFRGSKDEFIDLLHSVFLVNSLPKTREWDIIRAVLYSEATLELEDTLRTVKRAVSFGIVEGGAGRSKMKGKVGNNSKPNFSRRNVGRTKGEGSSQRGNA